VAKLPDPVISNLFIVKRRLAECIDRTTAMEFRLFEQAGETSETSSEFEELQNIEERLMISYNRLHTLLLKVCQSQPIPSEDMLNLLYRAIEVAEATLDASVATLQEIQRDSNYL
jgi:hypothetical protein